jgi:hypothetical protein
LRLGRPVACAPGSVGGWREKNISHRWTRMNTDCRPVTGVPGTVGGLGGGGRRGRRPCRPGGPRHVGFVMDSAWVGWIGLRPAIIPFSFLGVASSWLWSFCSANFGGAQIRGPQLAAEARSWRSAALVRRPVPDGSLYTAVCSPRREFTFRAHLRSDIFGPAKPPAAAVGLDRRAPLGPDSRVPLSGISGLPGARQPAAGRALVRKYLCAPGRRITEIFRASRFPPFLKTPFADPRIGGFGPPGGHLPANGPEGASVASPPENLCIEYFL